MEVAVRFRVTGKVQGVFFRASAAREALRLGLSGRAINLPDGSVDVLAIGPADAVAQLARWLHRGPPAARVDAVRSTPVGLPLQDPPQGFTTG